MIKNKRNAEQLLKIFLKFLLRCKVFFHKLF